MLDAALWILDLKRNFFISRLRRESSTSIKYPATSISTLQALKVINSYKLDGLRRSFARYYANTRGGVKLPFFIAVLHHLWHYPKNFVTQVHGSGVHGSRLERDED